MANLNSSGGMTPAWLLEDAGVQQAVAGVAVGAATTAMSDPSVRTAVAEQAWKEHGTVTQVDREDMPTKLKFAIKVTHILASFFLGLAATITLIIAKDLRTIVLCLYLWVFGVMLCLLETPLKLVNQALSGNCGFMESAGGRFFFLVLIGSLSLAFGVWGIIGGSISFLGAALNLYAGIFYGDCCSCFEKAPPVFGGQFNGQHSGKTAGAMGPSYAQQPGYEPPSSSSWPPPSSGDDV